jgi:hypothetical protein
MKAPLHPLINSSRSIIQPVTTHGPEPVGQAAAADDSSKTLMAGSERDHRAPPPPLQEAVEAEGNAVPYSGGDRRYKNRRHSSQTTTLDTRKEGMDRRKKGRISLKV